MRAQPPPLERDRECEEVALAVRLGRSPKAVFEGAVNEARGKLTQVERCLIGLMVAQRSGSPYWLSVQGRLAEKAGLTKDRISAAREGCGDTDRQTALLFLAGKLVINRGELADADLAAVGQAGLSDADVTEVIVHVGLNLTAAAVSHAAGLELDFPTAPPLPAF